MKIPTIQGVIKRRVLLNFRADPSVVQRVLPQDFVPKLHKDYAIAGICLIHLVNIRPKRLPEFIGVSSENAAHRIAVEWEDDGKTNEGVFVPRRDTDSTFNHLAGGRLFPSEHHKATFDIEENDEKINYSMASNDGVTSLNFQGYSSKAFPEKSVFSSLEEASGFFERGSLGYSSNRSGINLDGIKLKIDDWQVSPLKITAVDSSFYDDENIFPKDSIEYDHALLMRNIAHEWHSQKTYPLKHESTSI